MELLFFMGLVTPPIHFSRVILYVWDKPRLVSLYATCTLGGTYVPLCFPQCYADVNNTICSIYHLFLDSSPSLWQGCIIILLVVSWTGKINIPLSPCARKNLVLRDGFGSPVPRQPAHLHTQTECGAYLRDSSRFPRRRPFIYLNRHTPSGQSRVCRVTQLRTDSVHWRESAGSEPVNPKAAPNGCCLGRSPWTN